MQCVSFVDSKSNYLNIIYIDTNETKQWPIAGLVYGKLITFVDA